MIANCIVQARMGSTRLPGKVMRRVAGKPLIGYLIDSLLECKNIDKTIYAIPEKDKSSALGEYLGVRHVTIVLGPEDDVAARFRIALEKYPCDMFVRVCADSPLLEPGTVDEATFLWDNPYYHVGSIPGNQAEGFETKAFLKAEPDMDGEEREHLGHYFRNIYASVVDTPEDFERVKWLILQQQ